MRAGGAYESGMDIAYVTQRHCPGITNPMPGLLWWAAMGVEECRLHTNLAPVVQDGAPDVDRTRWGSFHPLPAVMMTCGGLVSLAGGDSPQFLAFVFFTAYLALAAALDGVVLYLTR